ncbi:hypothetical protein Moror_13291 [Moniliophthora roreri MCA 2997]|uniref:Uncharacterized protein n=1 Tax=Moniliophthora roreri (strain MCA 2997) TaxID=1381753 RepID=V2WCW3_MONRO|nr:hypothetical protein Moror_13291 [Moniliophthora roreri MCA 2997]KAI3604008.1 hypothetical protein WG66_000844 [Moniliophthora roreri]
MPLIPVPQNDHALQRLINVPRQRSTHTGPRNVTRLLSGQSTGYYEHPSNQDQTSLSTPCISFLGTKSCHIHSNQTIIPAAELLPILLDFQSCKAVNSTSWVLEDTRRAMTRNPTYNVAFRALSCMTSDDQRTSRNIRSSNDDVDG